MSEKTYIIKCGKLYDGKKDIIQEDMEILVRGNRIVEVAKKVTAVPGCDIIDLSDSTVTPGLIDAHVHFSYGDWHTRSRDYVYENPSVKGMYLLYNARKALRRGFTSVRHAGSNSDDGWGCVIARDLINKGLFEGSRVKVAPHYISTTRGHGDFSQLIKENPLISDFIWERYPGRVSGPDSCREVVRKQVKFGADFIKIFCSGGFNSVTDGPEDYTFTDDELRACIETAHRLNMKITSHTYSNELARKQIEMGIDGIEHGALITDPEIFRMMKERNIEYVPTFTPYEGAMNQDEDNLRKQTPGMEKKLRRYKDMLIESRRLVVNSDIEIGYGTDIVAVHNPYECGWEFFSMRNSGIDPFRALAAATRVNAKILDMAGEIGEISPGFLADIAAWKRDLLTDPSALLDCHFVMKDGVVYETEQDI